MNDIQARTRKTVINDLALEIQKKTKELKVAAKTATQESSKKEDASELAKLKKQIGI